jgi:hypothetical protein
MYDIKTVIASFLRKLQENFAHSQYFQFTPRNVLLWDFTKQFPNSPNIILVVKIGSDCSSSKILLIRSENNGFSDVILKSGFP